MKKKWIIIGIVIAVLVVLLFPRKLNYKDGGSVCYKAILYDVTKLHKLDDNEPDGYQDGLCIRILGMTVCDKSYCKVTINDSSECIYDIPTEEYFTPGTVLKFHSGIICDANLGMYVNGEFYAIQDAVDTGSGYIWEYTYEVGSEDVLIEFRIIGGKCG